jgi:hypothetical protein
MSHEFEFYHGVALCKIIHASTNATIRLYCENGNSSYIINDDIGIFVKYSTKRMSPWQFTFTKDHCNELFGMVKRLRVAFLVLVCRDNGIACLNFSEIKTLLNDSLCQTQSILVTRKPREKFRVSCRKYEKVKLKVADSEFPAKIFRL